MTANKDQAAHEATATDDQFVVVNKKEVEDINNQESSTTDQTSSIIEIPPEIFLTGLTILSPLQKSTDGNVVASSSSSTTATAVPLPPLRPDEPVASIRNAISEVIGFAHMTKYRLVLERTSTTTVAGTDASATKNGGDGKSKKKKKNHRISNGNSNTSEVKDWEKDNVVSPYTLEGAELATDTLLKTLKAGYASYSTSTDNSSEGEEQVFELDDYGDLSILFELLKKDGKVGEPENGKIIVDASSFALRVVLERYDVASVRNHLVRARALLEGNAPHLETLMSEEDELDAEAEQEGDEKTVKDEVSLTTSLYQNLLYCNEEIILTK